MIDPVNIGFEDDDLLIAWKPHGTLTSGNSNATFRLQIQKLTQTAAEPCHRLDFGTSGWVIFGKHAKAVTAMNVAFEQRSVNKRYVALVHGTFPTSMDIRLPISGQSAHSRVECIENGRIAGAGDVALVEVHLFTGRTHQIRRHLCGLGHALVGDDRYAFHEGIYRGKGLFLSAWHLDFAHPLSGARIEVSQLPGKKFTKIPFVHRSGFEKRIHLSSQSR